MYLCMYVFRMCVCVYMYVCVHALYVYKQLNKTNDGLFDSVA